MPRDPLQSQPPPCRQHLQIAFEQRPGDAFALWNLLANLSSRGLYDGEMLTGVFFT